MRISTRGRYSLEALLYLALLQDANSGVEYSSTRSISAETGVSERYLEQLFIPLRGKNILTGIRGPRGGYFLGRPAGEITVGDVLRAVEGPMEVTECAARAGEAAPKGEACPKMEQCQSRHTWKELYDEINNTINALTLEDLVRDYKSTNP